MVTKQLLQEWANPKTCSLADSSQSVIECPKNLCIWEIYRIYSVTLELSGLFNTPQIEKMCRCAAAPLRTLWSWQALQLSHCNAVPLPLSSRDQNEDMQCSHYIHQEDRLITVSACFLSLAVSSCAGHWYSALKLEATKEMWSRQVICMCVCVCVDYA